MTPQAKSPAGEAGFKPRSAALEADALPLGHRDDWHRCRITYKVVIIHVAESRLGPVLSLPDSLSRTYQYVMYFIQFVLSRLIPVRAVELKYSLSFQFDRFSQTMIV